LDDVCYRNGASDDSELYAKIADQVLSSWKFAYEGMKTLEDWNMIIVLAWQESENMVQSSPALEECIISRIKSTITVQLEKSFQALWNWCTKEIQNYALIFWPCLNVFGDCPQATGLAFNLVYCVIWHKWIELEFTNRKFQTEVLPLTGTGLSIEEILALYCVMITGKVDASHLRGSSDGNSACGPNKWTTIFEMATAEAKALSRLSSKEITERVVEIHVSHSQLLSSSAAPDPYGGARFPATKAFVLKQLHINLRSDSHETDSISIMHPIFHSRKQNPRTNETTSDLSSRFDPRFAPSIHSSSMAVMRTYAAKIRSDQHDREEGTAGIPFTHEELLEGTSMLGISDHAVDKVFRGFSGADRLVPG